jgi:hypothetical protein
LGGVEQTCALRSTLADADLHLTETERRAEEVFPMKKSVVSLMTALALFSAQSRATAEPIGVLTSVNRLGVIDSTAPDIVISPYVPITGLQPGEFIHGIDVRPATGVLYGLGSAGRLYTLDPLTGTAALQAVLITDPTDTTNPFSALSGTAFGVDFNPVADRLRVVSNAQQNLRIDVDNGQVLTDGTLSGLPQVVASAYTNNLPGATTTTLYGIDFGGSRIVIQLPSDDGTLTTVGPLGFRGSPFAGFDISSLDGTAFAAFSFTGPPSRDNPLYTINLNTGAATFVGTIGGLEPGERVLGIATVQPIVPEPGSFVLTAVGLVRLLGYGWRRCIPSA